MARHASETNNTEVAPYVWVVAAIAVIALIAAGIWALVTPKSEEAAAPTAECAAGPLTFSVAAGPNSVVRSLGDQYAASAPVVQDYCVSPTFGQDMAQAAAFAAAGSPQSISQTLQAAGRTPASSKWTIAGETRLGIAHRDGVDFPGGTWGNLANTDVAFVRDQQNVSTLIAAAMAGGDPARAQSFLTDGEVESIQAAVDAERPYIAVSEADTPAGYTFYSPDGFALPTYFVPLTATDAVDENQVRAASDFAAYIATQVADTPLSDEHEAWLLAGEQMNGSAAPNSDPSASGVVASDTLFLLNTSAAMAAESQSTTWIAAAKETITATAAKVTEAGKQVALWNYSSPLNPGVVKGWRANTDFGPASGIAEELSLLTTGGDSWTRSSVVAALQQGAVQAQATGAPVTVLVISTGSAQEMDDAEFTAQLDAARGTADVRVNVITIGGAQPDAALQVWTEAHGGLTTNADTPQAMDTGVRGLAGVQ